MENEEKYNLSSAIYITNEKRDIKFYIVAVTKVGKGRDIVIRYASEIPFLPSNADVVLVDSRGYEARSSFGHFRYIPTKTGKYSKMYVVGMMTFEKSLRPVAPFPVYVIKDAAAKRIRTQDYSNYSCRDAIGEILVPAWEQKYDCGVLIMEGQSDWENIISIQGQDDFCIENFCIEEEYNTEVMNKESITIKEISSQIQKNLLKYGVHEKDPEIWDLNALKMLLGEKYINGQRDIINNCDKQDIAVCVKNILRKHILSKIDEEKFSISIGNETIEIEIKKLEPLGIKAEDKNFHYLIGKELSDNENWDVTVMSQFDNDVYPVKVGDKCRVELENKREDEEKETIIKVSEVFTLPINLEYNRVVWLKEKESC